MAILVLEEDFNVRVSLSRMLRSLGHRCVLVASNAEEAEIALHREYRRIEFILVDITRLKRSSYFHFMHRLSKDQNIQQIPVLLLHAGLSKRESETFKAQFPSVDFFLEKPFGSVLLARAMDSAYASRRDRPSSFFVLLNPEGEASRRLKEYLISMTGKTFWSVGILPLEISAFENEIQQRGKNMGALIVSTEAYLAIEKASHRDWLRQVRRSIAPHSIIACLGEGAEHSASLRCNCQLYLEVPSSVQQWHDTLETVRRKSKCQLPSLRDVRRSKEACHEGNFGRASKLAWSAVKSDPNNWVAYSLLGDIATRHGSRKRALTFYERSLAKNPFYVFPYIRLMEALKREPSPSLSDLEARAFRFCPNSPVIRQVLSRQRNSLPNEAVTHSL